MADFFKDLFSAFEKERSKEMYGPATSLAPGAGVIYEAIKMPIYLPNKMAYATGDGLGVILTHECDIDRDNARAYNDHALVAPIIPFYNMFDALNRLQSEAETKTFMLNVVNNKVHRILYIPPYGTQNKLQHGGFIDFNKITTNFAPLLFGQNALCALSQYGMKCVDAALHNHLFREKSERLPLPS